MARTPLTPALSPALSPAVRASLALVLAALAGAAQARAFTATATHVTDGDTVWVRPASGGAPRALRIAGIDAPELCQAHGPAAREALERKLGTAPLRVVTQARDGYGRTVARLERGREDIGRWMAASGHAWSQRYRGQGPYLQEEAQARRRGRGLWARGDAVEPGAFRKAHGSCHAADRTR